MQILAIDIGTGTQDILLFDTSREPENALKMIMPSPTQRVAHEVRLATQSGVDVLLMGITMGGGPCAWAVDEHLQAGYRVFATSAAACTLDDDPEVVTQRGVQLVGDDEAGSLRRVQRIVMRDVDQDAIRHSFGAFGVVFEPEAIGVAVFDHGAAPPGFSDRRFRFDYLAQRLQTQPELSALAFPAEDVPPFMSRMRAVADQLNVGHLLVMDTPSAAVLGAQEDPVVRAAPDCVSVNIGNQHTLAFRLHIGQVTGLFEHHTGMLSRDRLEQLIEQLARGAIDNNEVFDDRGHGALLLQAGAVDIDMVTVTGPRRTLLRGSPTNPYFAVPHGDMMLAGCWGLVRAMAVHMPTLADEIISALSGGG